MIKVKTNKKKTKNLILLENEKAKNQFYNEFMSFQDVDLDCRFWGLIGLAYLKQRDFPSADRNGKLPSRQERNSRNKGSRLDAVKSLDNNISITDMGGDLMTLDKRDTNISRYYQILSNRNE